MILDSPVAQARMAAWRPPDRRPIYEWAEENYFVPRGALRGWYRADNAPWTKGVLDAFVDPLVREITVMCSAQSSKTETMLLLLAWMIAEDPGDCMWVTSTKDEAEMFWIERMLPALEACPRTAELIPRDRRLSKNCEIHFRTMTLELIGANNLAKLQSKPRRYLMLDEVRNWKPRALPTVLKRVRSYWNSKTVILSTPGSEKDAVHQHFLAGDQQVYFVVCPYPDCKQEFTLRDLDLDYVPAESKVDGRWDFELVKTLTKYVCPHCGKPIADTHENRRGLASSEIWRPQNSKAPRSKRSFTWNALLPPWVKWGDLAEEKILGKAALMQGDIEPLYGYVTESLGEPWKMEYSRPDGKNPAFDRRGNFKLRESWPHELRNPDSKVFDHRYLAADIQQGIIYYVCRAFGPGGISRMIDCGTVPWFGDLREKVKQLEVWPWNVVIDTGYMGATIVYPEIIKSGRGPNGDYIWKAFKGDKAQSFAGEDHIRQLWTVTQLDPMQGTKDQGYYPLLNLYRYSNAMAKDLTWLHMSGQGPLWEIAQDTPHEYFRHVSAEIRKEIDSPDGVEIRWENPAKAPNHWWDCEVMIMAAASIRRITGIPEHAIAPGQIITT
jgi:phage terminase large subunit GpA-like protein